MNRSRRIFIDPVETHSYFYQNLRIRVLNGQYMTEDDSTVQIDEVVVVGAVEYVCVDKDAANILLEEVKGQTKGKCNIWTVFKPTDFVERNRDQIIQDGQYDSIVAEGRLHEYRRPSAFADERYDDKHRSDMIERMKEEFGKSGF